MLWRPPIKRSYWEVIALTSNVKFSFRLFFFFSKCRLMLYITLQGNYAVSGGVKGIEAVEAKAKSFKARMTVYINLPFNIIIFI